ncbi:YybH family protein [Algoriphagus chordae]|uniref:Ketosteroid isomerase-like protein n=1 Tax=Algoriphagus chordae TaxID=237019 RepID=A0A2W7QWT4_9BACT|nr:nuclear transport factor 2 family protein [Algoriphagus chordae]PZX50540.1 ketosteroid isomerase-like protein [Algoriphagus chordae]
MQTPFKISFTVWSIMIFAVMATSCQSNSEKEAQELVTNKSIASEEEAIKAALIDMWDAVEKADVDRYASHIHPDFTQFGEYDPVLREGKEAEVEANAAWVADSKDIHTEMLDPKITIKGDVAWITYYWKDHGETAGKAFASTGKSTRIFVKENDRWLCIHGHYTLLTAE